MEKSQGSLTTTKQRSDFEQLPLRKAFLKALVSAPAGSVVSAEGEKKETVTAPERRRKATHIRYSKPLFLKEAQLYEDNKRELENELRGTKRLRKSYDDEEEEVCRFVTAKHLLEESGIVLQPLMTRSAGRGKRLCQFQRQGCPRCNVCNCEATPQTVNKAIESTLFKYKNATTKDGSTASFAVSSIGDLLLNFRDDIDTVQNKYGNKSWDGTIRQRQFLHRMLSPLVGYCLHCEDIIGVVGASLVDILLHVKPFQPHVLSALILSFRSLTNCSILLTDTEDYSTILIQDLIDLITDHIERLASITCDSVLMVWRSDNSDTSPLITSGKELMEQIKNERWWKPDSVEMMNHSERASYSSFCDNSIIKIFHRLKNLSKENEQQVILTRLSHQPPIRDRTLLRSVRMQILQQSLLDQDDNNRFLVGRNNNFLNKGKATGFILGYKNSILMRIKQARSAAEKRISLLSDVDEQRHPKMRLSRISGGNLVSNTLIDNIAEERATSSVEVFLDAADISREDFVKHATFLDKVHRMFTTHNFVAPGQQNQRPTLRHIRLSNECRQKLLNIFFDDDGSLKNDIVEDIDFSTENDPRYIDFGNTAENGRKDRRYQIGLKKQILGGRPVKTRLEIESIFAEMGIISPDRECLDEIGLLIGGTEDQSLHHDIARKFVHWYEEPKSGKVVFDDHSTYADVLVGWEVDRLQYNRMISSPSGPAAVLIAMGPRSKMLLGVQKDQILRDSVKSKECTILRGDGTRFEIVRENDSIVVVSICGGVLFTGEFPHCGVRNFQHGTKEDELMEEISSKIAHFIKIHGPQQRLPRDKAVITMFCNLPGMNRLTRLHCSIVTRDRGLAQIPFNTIGYANCFNNERDDRCFQNDRFLC